MTCLSRAVVLVSAGTCFVLFWASVGCEQPVPILPKPIAASAPGSVTITLPSAQSLDGDFRVENLPPALLQALASQTLTEDEWTSLFSVAVSAPDAQPGDAAPILGSYSVKEATLDFHPRFPLLAGVAYSVRFNPAKLLDLVDMIPADLQHLVPPIANQPPILLTHVVPTAKATATTTVTEVFPSGQELPENLLKFYVHFSAPMSKGQAYQRIHLLDAEGKRVYGPFLEIAEELWDPSGTRLTILFDPGRIKRGLRPREEEGPALEAGKRYTLLVEQKWNDAAGQPLVEEFRKPFVVTAPDNMPPDQANWKIEPPPAGSHTPLVVTFSEPLDHAELQRMLTVVAPDGNPVSGKIAVDRAETRWQFSPEGHWRAGKHHLIIDTTLEDRAGNSLGRPFEVDVFNEVEQRKAAETVVLEFSIAAP